jgi:hypothetical protein
MHDGRVGWGDKRLGLLQPGQDDAVRIGGARLRLAVAPTVTEHDRQWPVLQAKPFNGGRAQVLDIVPFHPGMLGQRVLRALGTFPKLSRNCPIAKFDADSVAGIGHDLEAESQRRALRANRCRRP